MRNGESKVAVHTHTHTHTTLDNSAEVFHTLKLNNKLRQDNYAIMV